MRRTWEILTGRRTAAVLLVFFSVLSVGLACLGADGALSLMKHGAAVCMVGAFGALAVLAAARTWRRPSIFALHLGFALVLGGWVANALFGVEDGYLRLRAGQEGRVAASENAHGFNLELQDFSIDRWEDTGSVRQYTSRAILREDGENRAEPVEISVNHPLVRAGWWVYQSSYEEVENPHTGRPLYFTVLSCVNDIGLPVVTLGGALLLLGVLGFACADLRGNGLFHQECGRLPVSGSHLARCTRALYGLAFLCALAMLLHRGFVTGHPPMQNLYEFLMCAAVLIPVLTWVSAKADRQDTLLVDAALLALVMVPVCFVMDGGAKRLMPALQSPFFVPHVGSYVLGYILLVRAAFGAGRRLVCVGFLLLTAGLVLGAAWGKVCWGHWWQFDPKEMWSLATWFVYAAFFHLRARLSPRATNVFLAVGAVMIVLTLTWVNLSRIFPGMHSYA